MDRAPLDLPPTTPEAGQLVAYQGVTCVIAWVHLDPHGAGPIDLPEEGQRALRGHPDCAIATWNIDAHRAVILHNVPAARPSRNSCSGAFGQLPAPVYSELNQDGRRLLLRGHWFLSP